MAKNKKHRAASGRTYQDMKRNEAMQKKALSDEALLPKKRDGRKISIVGALVMLAVGFGLFFFTGLHMLIIAFIALLCGSGAIFLMTYLTIRRNREQLLREMKLKK